MKSKQFLLIFYFFAIIMNSQIDFSFIKYLSKNNLQREHFAYLNNLENQTDSDTLYYLKAKYYLKYFNDSLFYKNYLLSKNIFINDTSTFNKANILFLKPNLGHEIRSKWFNSLKNESLSFVSNSINYTYEASISPVNINPTYLPISIQQDFLKYKKKYAKKPVIAGALSAIIPGLGKLYAGRKRSFVTVFFTHLVYGIQSYESIHKLGIRNSYSIFSLSFFSVFYTANIYGSYQDVIQVKKETKTQFLINAANYYNFNYSDSTN